MAQSFSTITSSDLLAASPSDLARLLEAARPAPVPANERARILGGIPEEGQVHDLDASSRGKLDGLVPLLHVVKRQSVYEIIVIDVPQAAVAIHERLVLLISRVALGLLSVDELQALVAHEIGHEYVWGE